MKKYLKLIYNSFLGIALRNIVGFRPPKYILENKTSYSASDLFVWRTDNGYSTIFKASNILKKFYGEDSSLLFFFFDQQGREIFSKTLNFHGNIAELTIDSDFVGREGLGTFCAFNILKSPSEIQVKATNRCYVGYGKRGAYSMVHGNLIALYTTKLTKLTFDSPVSMKPAMSSRKGAYKYYIQKPNQNFFSNSLVFANPLERYISVSVSGKTFKLGSKCCEVIHVDNDDETIVIESDFIFPRPLVFSETGDFVDVHHS